MATSHVSKVALIGCGIMGAPIAGHILDAGYQLTVHTRTRAKAEGLIARGARWADTPAEAAHDADLVLTMVGEPTDVEDVYFGSNGVLEAAPVGSYLVDLTTSSPQLARELHDAAEVMDKHAFDCPVTGGEEGAIDGTLTLIVGADETYAAPVMDVLSTFAGKVYYFDHAGAGQSAKLCNQVSLSACMIGWADAVALAQASGVDAARMLEMVSVGMGGSTALARLAPRALEGDYAPGFFSAYLRKDLGLALAEAEDLDLALPGAETGFMMYDTICEAGGGRLGTQAISLLYGDDDAAAAAGLDWSLLQVADEDEHDHGHDHHHHHH